LSGTETLRLVGAKAEPGVEPIDFLFEGERIAALPGESLAAALTAAGHLDLRQAGPGDRRGVFCGMGVCQECLVEIDGRGAQRACVTGVISGMQVRRHDPATAQLVALCRRPESDPPIESTEVAIVGAGPAGLAAAIALAEAGLHPIVLDERAAPGGQYYKPLAPSQKFRPGGEDRQFASGRELVAKARAFGVDIRSAQAVWQGAKGLDGRITLGIHAPSGAYVLETRAVLVATGAYEQPLHIPGWTLPGVMTTGAAQTFARAYRVAPGHRVLVAGNGPLNWQLALEIAEGGGHVIGVVEAARPLRTTHAGAALSMLLAAPALTLAGLAMRIRLQRAGIPLHEGYRLARLDGGGRVERAVAMAIDGRLPPLSFEVDSVAMGYGFAPSTELARLLGVEVSIDAATGYAVPVLDAEGRAPDRPIWVAGDAGGIGGSAIALAQGRVAAVSVLEFLQRGDARSRRAALRAGGDLHRARSFQRGLWSMFAMPLLPEPTAETIVCRCENVTAGQIAILRDAGVRDLGSLKRETRLGMGRCQGRYCAAAALRMLAGTDATQHTGTKLFAPQAPIKPVPAILLAREKPEWGGHREVALRPRGPPSLSFEAVPERCDLVIIGAGIVGASTALFAAGEGIDTLVIDRLSPNSEASGGNAGSLHIQLLSWDFGAKAMAGGHPALQTLPLQRDSVALWKSLEQELGDFEIVTTGGLMVAENESQTAFLKAKAEAEKQAGIAVEVLGRTDLATLAPAISERMVVAAYCAAEGKINPLKATPAIVNEARRRGARFAAGHEVLGLETEAGGYLVTTTHAKIKAQRVVIAAGGWSRLLGRLLGVELPISGAPLQMLVTEPTRPILRQLIAHADRHLTMKQATNGNLIIGGAWTADTDTTTGYARVLRHSIEGNLWVAERTLPALGGLHLLRSWAAMNVNIDGAPLLGEVPGLPGVFIAATANGYTLGPIVGQVTTDLLLGRPRPDIDGFTLRRFG
jgi:glycine/D-amino acid oxidase-like deaminating enzyme